MIAPEADPAAVVAPTPLQAIRRNLGWLVASRGFLAVLSLVYLAIAARSLGVVGFGRFALISGAAQTLATLVAFQTWQIVVQFGVEPLQHGDRGALARLFRGGVVLDFAGAVIGVVLAFVILELFAERLGISPTLKRATLLFTAVQILTVRSALLGILRLRGRFGAAALADGVTPVTRLLGAAAVSAFHPTVQGFLFAWGLAEILTAGAYWLLIAHNGDLRLLLGGRGIMRLPNDHPGLVRFALSTNASATLGLSGKQVALLLAGALVSPAAAGVFRLAVQLAQGLAKFSQLIARAAYPEVVKALAGASAAMLRKVMLRLLAASALGAIVILGITALIGKPVLLLIGGKSFGGAWQVLPWLAVASSIDLATVGLETVLTAVRRAGTILAIRCAGTLALVVGALTLAPTYGASGVAVAVAAGSLLMAAGMTLAALHIARRRATDERSAVTL